MDGWSRLESYIGECLGVVVNRDLWIKQLYFILFIVIWHFGIGEQIEYNKLAFYEMGEIFQLQQILKGFHECDFWTYSYCETRRRGGATNPCTCRIKISMCLVYK